MPWPTGRLAPTWSGVGYPLGLGATHNSLGGHSFGQVQEAAKKRRKQVDVCLLLFLSGNIQHSPTITREALILTLKSQIIKELGMKH